MGRSGEVPVVGDEHPAGGPDELGGGPAVPEGETGRPTEGDAQGSNKREPSRWREASWPPQEAATGRSRDEVLVELRRLLRRSLSPGSERR